MKKEYAKHDEEFKKMIVSLCETSKDKTMSDIASDGSISARHETIVSIRINNTIYLSLHTSFLDTIRTFISPTIFYNLK